MLFFQMPDDLIHAFNVIVEEILEFLQQENQPSSECKSVIVLMEIFCLFCRLTWSEMYLHVLYECILYKYMEQNV